MLFVVSRRLALSGAAVAALLFLLTGASVFAHPAAPAPATPEAVIAQDVAAQVAHDWTAFLNLRTVKPDMPENRADWSSWRARYPSDDRLSNIVSARLVGAKPIPRAEAAGLTRLGEYLEAYGDVQAYYVAIDYRLKKESRAWYNGVNYRLYLLGQEDGRWVIVEASEMRVASMLRARLGFGTREEQVALGIQARRVRTGQFTNATGKVIETLTVGDHAQPSHIRVYLVTPGIIDEVDFYQYVTNVLPNEWISSWYAASLQAGAIAVKMYGWYHVYFAKYPTMNYDVKDSTGDQVYKPGSANGYTTPAVDAVQGVGFDSASGDLFEAQYWDGRGVTSNGGQPVPLYTGPGLGYPVNVYVDDGKTLGVLSSGTTVADGYRWWYVKTNGVSPSSAWTPGTYTVGWIQSTYLVSYWGNHPSIDNFLGRMTQWGTYYWSDPRVGEGNQPFDWIVHKFYDNAPQTGGQLAHQFAYTPNRSPLQPNNIEPADGEIVFTATPRLRASDFSDPDPGDYHWQTWWEVRRLSDGVAVWTSGWRTTDLTATTVPPGYLSYLTYYYFLVRYMDNKGGLSEPLPVSTRFMTSIDPATAHYLYFPLSPQGPQ